MMEDLLAEFSVISGQVRERRPLLHHITNYVTAGFCADAGLALGALPMMTDAPEEVEAAARRAALPYPKIYELFYTNRVYSQPS